MLRLRFKPSHQLAVSLMAGYVIAAVCLLMVPLPFWLRSLLLCALLLNILYVLPHQVWRAWPFSVVSLQFERDGVVFLECRNGKIFAAKVLAGSFVAPYLTIILLQSNKAWFARSVVLLPDMLSVELFRSLRVWLKWRLGRGAAPEAGIDWTGQL